MLFLFILSHPCIKANITKQNIISTEGSWQIQNRSTTCSAGTCCHSDLPNWADWSASLWVYPNWDCSSCPLFQFHLSPVHKVPGRPSLRPARAGSCQLLPCDGCKALCMAAEAAEGLIQGMESREVVVVVVMVTWIICSFCISLMRVLRRSSDDWVPFCWAIRLVFSSKHFCQMKRRGERRKGWEYIQSGVKHLSKHPLVPWVHVLLKWSMFSFGESKTTA